MTPHIGDTEQFRVQAGTPRTWSPYRTGTLVALVAAAALFGLAVIGRRGERVIELPAPGIDILRAALAVSVLAFLAACAHDRLSPVLWRHFAALRIGSRELDARVGELESQLARLDERGRRMESALVQIAQHEETGERLMASLTAAVAAYGADMREDGYLAAMADGRVTVPVPRAVVALAAGSHLRSV